MKKQSIKEISPLYFLSFFRSFSSYLVPLANPLFPFYSFSLLLAVRQYEKAVNKGDNGAQEKLRNAQKQQKMASRKDYYKILSVAKTASAGEIKKAYRKLAFLYHPGMKEKERKR